MEGRKDCSWGEDGWDGVGGLEPCSVRETGGNTSHRGTSKYP